MLNSEASAGVDSYGGRPRWGQLRQVCTRRRRELTSPSTIGFPFSFGKKKCPLGPDSPRRDKRGLDVAGGPPREVPEASMREGESECPSRRGIRWGRAIMSLACDVEQGGFHGRRLLRGKTQVGALRQVCTRRRRELTSPSTIGFPFYFGKKKCPEKLSL